MNRKLAADTIARGFRCAGKHVLRSTRNGTTRLSIEGVQEPFWITDDNIKWPPSLPAETVAVIDLDLRSAEVLAQEKQEDKCARRKRQF